MQTRREPAAESPLGEGALIPQIEEGPTLTNPGHAAFWLSLIGLLVLALSSYAKNKNIRHLVLYVALLAACGGTYALLFQSEPRVQSKGPHSSEVRLVAILYAFMLAGIISNSCYSFLMKAQHNRRFDLGKFLAPIFISPIVFIPLLAAFQSTDIDLANLTLPKYMVFFVAFENGFLWKQVFEKRGAEQKS